MTVLPKIQANQAGAADALMLDIEGFVSETNATNVFMVKHGKIFTPSADACLPGTYAIAVWICSVSQAFSGITRQTVIDLVANILEVPPVEQRRISLVEFHTADEVFTSGTMGELTPVVEIDGRRIGDGNRPITRLISEHFRVLTESEGVKIPGV
jgi:protein-lysine N-methyltransferase EEF2KMT